LIDPGGYISTQVVNEFVNVSRLKLRADWRAIGQRVSAFEQTLEIEPLTLETSRKALAIAERYQLQIYDANIWAAAILAGCETLYSEDMHDGLMIEGTTLRNPFSG